MNMHMNSGFKVIQPGIFSLIEDAGRFGQHGIGLTSGGPLDREAFRWANRLCGDQQTAAAIEVTVGGLVLESQVNTTIAVTGANIPLSINKQAQALWQSHQVKVGDRIELGFASSGSRGYLAVAGGFTVEPIFNSVATVPREALGGLHRDGTALKTGDFLPCGESLSAPQVRVPNNQRPDYSTNSAVLRVVLGYQQQAFSNINKQLFFSSEYQVTESSDRMGFRLKGPAIKPTLDGILSEGICLGAIQVPADGQPIVLLNDRQTIGGYPKLGSVLSLDIGKLAQLLPGGTLRFEAISIEQAHNLLVLDQQRFANTILEKVTKQGAEHE
jgi:biotin-dependent carboxylase-like uncharacterized protein